METGGRQANLWLDFAEKESILRKGAAGAGERRAGG